jgi:hypothetical protein
MKNKNASKAKIREGTNGKMKETFNYSTGRRDLTLFYEIRSCFNIGKTFLRVIYVFYSIPKMFQLCCCLGMEVGLYVKHFKTLHF